MDWTDTENLRPLKTGRSFTGKVVSDVEATPKAVLQAADEKRAELLRQIDSYSGDNPLPLWVRLIKFVNQEYKTGSKSQLVPLLERCTRELMTTDQYKDNVNFLRLWIQYADSLPEPGDVFTFLEDHGVGQRHALLYEAHASFLERSKAHAKARAAFELGISRFAAPLERLQNNFDGFKARMEQREERRARGEMSAAPEQAGPVDENGAPASRRTFAELSTRRPTDGQRPGNSSRPARGLVGIKRPVPASGAAGNDSVEVFVDEEFGGEASSESYQAPRSRMDSVPSFEAGRKENTAVAVPLGSKGFRIPQRQGAAPQPAPELDIYVDEDLMDEQLPMPPTTQVSVRRHLDVAPSSQAALEDAPLRLHNAAAAASLSATPSLPKTAPAMICDPQSLVDSQGREVCFEELRAEHMRRQATSLTAAEPDSLSNRDPAAKADVLPCAAAVSPASLFNSVEPAAAGRTPHANAPGCQTDPAAPSPMPERQPLSDGTISSPVPKAVRNCAAEDEVPDENTIPSTAPNSAMLLIKPSVGQKGAPRTALGLRSVTAPAGSVPFEQQQATRAGGGDLSSSIPCLPGGGGDDTISYDLFGGAFSGALPEALPAGLEPTVTINTLEAYSEMNDMFQSTLPHVPPNPGPRTAVPLPPKPPGGRRKSGVFASRISRQSSVLPAYATQTLPALHELEQAAHDGSLTACLGAASRGLQQFDDIANAPTASNQQPDDDGPGLVYEDTEFLPTICTDGVGIGGIDGADDCILVREDTQFLQEQGRATLDGQQAAQPSTVLASPPYSHRAATRSVSRALFSPTSHLALMPSEAGPSSAAPSTLRVNPSAYDEIPFDNKENKPLPGSAGPVIHTGQSLPTSQALQPCSERRGIKVGTGYASDEDELVVSNSTPPAAILAQAGSSLQDEFEVYCDVRQ